MDPLIGQVVLDRYEVLRRIGSGGMGAVYVGRQKAVGRDVALKILRTDLMSNEHVRERFRREAEIIGKLRHPNTIQLIDYGETPDGLAVMVMELLVGRPLNDRLKESGPLPLAQALEIGIQIASSLAEAHLIGLVHRDLKPANIFLVEVAGQVHAKVLDFGIARILDEEATRLTSTGQVFGTPRYMSPEQALSTGEVDSRSDIYSLGLIIYECIVGQPPFVAQTSIQYLSAHSSQAPPKLRDSFQDAPPELEVLVDRCLAKDPGDRPQSADQVAEALKAIKRAVESGTGMQPIPILQAPPRSSSGEGATIPHGSGTRTFVDDRTLLRPEKKKPEPAKKTPILLAAGAVVVLGLCGVGAWAFFNTEPTETPSAPDAAVRAQGAPDAAAAIAVVDTAKDAEPSIEAAPDASAAIGEAEVPDAGHAVKTKTKHGGSKTKRGGEVGTEKDGVVTGPAKLTMHGIEDDKEDAVKLAKGCKASEVTGPAHLTLKCPNNCAVIVGEKCAGRTPAKEVAVPIGFKQVVVVCGAKKRLDQQIKFTADETTELRCR
jgi:serine/threonine-protein kinase